MIVCLFLWEKRVGVSERNRLGITALWSIQNTCVVPFYVGPALAFMTVFA